MNQSPEVAPGRRGAKFVVGGAVIALVLIGLTAWAMNRPAATSFYLTTTELTAMGPTSGARDYRVNGTVVPGSIDTDGLVTNFVITDGDTTMDIVTDRPLPDTFKASSEVVARGRFDGETFTATEVLAKCPSKFKAKD
ncbi:MAG: cytochrome c maturation protein CcmE [Actinomycetota bacterium]